MGYSREGVAQATLRNEIKDILKSKDFGTRQALVLLKETFPNDHQRWYLISQAKALVGSVDDAGKTLTFLDAVNVLVAQIIELQKETENGVKNGRSI